MRRPKKKYKKYQQKLPVCYKVGEKHLCSNVPNSTRTMIRMRRSTYKAWAQSLHLKPVTVKIPGFINRQITQAPTPCVPACRTDKFEEEIDGDTADSRKGQKS